VREDLAHNCILQCMTAWRAGYGKYLAAHISYPIFVKIDSTHSRMTAKHITAAIIEWQHEAWEGQYETDASFRQCGQCLGALVAHTGIVVPATHGEVSYDVPFAPKIQSAFRKLC
jgi:hypothetical protein